MGLFRKRHKFKLSPLSLSVPLDGCDSVVGLQELQRQKDSDQLAKALNLSATYGSSSKPSQRRHKGISLWNLTLEDAQQKHRPWLDFLWGVDSTSYSLCEGLTHLGERAEENLAYWLPNYLRIFLIFILCIVIMRPWSILGVAVLATIALWAPVVEIYNREKILPLKQQRQLTLRQLVWEGLQQRGRQLNKLAYKMQLQQETQLQTGSGEQPATQQQAGGVGEEVARSWGFMVCTFVVFFTGIPGVLAKATVYTALVALSHSTLRQTPMELAVAVRNAGQHGSMQCAGVPFLEVLGLSHGRNPDPRRLIKESWSTMTAIASAAGIYVWHAAQSKCSNSLRYFRA